MFVVNFWIMFCLFVNMEIYNHFHLIRNDLLLYQGGQFLDVKKIDIIVLKVSLYMIFSQANPTLTQTLKLYTSALKLSMELVRKS